MKASAEMEKVLAMSGRDAVAWMQAVMAGDLVVAPDFNWPALAAGMATRAADIESSTWAILGYQLYEHLASKERDQAECERLLYAAMSLRAKLIRQFKVSDEDVHAARLASWFQERLPMSFEEATERASSWTTLPVEQLALLRGIKNRLNILAGLEHEPVLARYPDLARWLSLRSMLP